jgi:outer membrane lipoprotein LolB
VILRVARVARRVRVVGLLLGLAALSGCATRPAADSAMPWTSGRLSVRVEATVERSASSVSADFDLRGDSSRGELRLSSPLGAVLAATRWSAAEVVLDTGQGPIRYADLESLSRDALGEALPLRAFPDWLAGRPWPGAPSSAQADGFEQMGWAVSLTGFAVGRLEAVRAAAPKVTVRVRLEKAAS